MAECVVYRATVQPSNVNYVGMAKTDFKARYRNHMQSFKNPQKRNTTTLAQYVWNHALNPNPNIKWEILKNCSVYRPGNKACDLCICEKLAILESTNNPLNINKRNDIGGRCIHRRCCALDNIT